MTKLLDGTVIGESFNAVHYFTPQQCKQFYGMDRIVEYITIHHWGNLGQNFDDVVNFLCSRRDNNPTSAHAVIMAGRAESIIDPDNAGFHSGNATGNARSIGLECRPEATEGDYLTVACYIVYLRSIYGNVPLRRHSDWFATACPGKWDLGKLDALAYKLAGGAPLAETGNEDELSAEDSRLIKLMYDRIFGRDRQRYINPNNPLEVSEDAKPGWTPARSTDLHDIIALRDLMGAHTKQVLEAVKAIPSVDNAVIDKLSAKLQADLDAATKNLRLTLAPVQDESNPA